MRQPIQLRMRGQRGNPIEIGEEKQHLADRVTQLEHENAALKGRLDSATARTKQMLERVRFIRLQAQGGGER